MQQLQMHQMNTQEPLPQQQAHGVTEVKPEKKIIGEDTADIKPRKRQVVAEKSPVLSTEAPPNPTGWNLAKDPRDAEGKMMIWVSEPRNEVETLPTILVVERKDTASRFLCLKCNYLFWGSKKRVKEHLISVGQDRVAGSTAWVKGCKLPMTPQEQAFIDKEPLEATQTRTGRTPKVPAVYKGSPWPTSELPPAQEGWSPFTAPDGTDIWVSGMWGGVYVCACVCVCMCVESVHKYCGSQQGRRPLTS